MTRLLTLFAALLFALPALAQNRHALVVGIDRYAHIEPLQRAVSDARAVAVALEQAGFAVDLRIDPGEVDLVDAITDLGRRVGPGDEVVVYFAGHGIEVNGANYLLPADVPALAPGQELMVRRRAVPLEDITDALDDRRVRVSLIILDACRDNPFPRQGTRSVGGTRGLARIDPPRGSFIVYSAAAGQTALDHLGPTDTDPHSVFARALLPRLAQPGLGVRALVQEVRSEVVRTAARIGHDQFPEVHDRLDGDLVLRPGEGAVPTPSPADPCAAALPVWAAIQTSDSAAALEAFAATYAPSCPVLAALARDRLAALAPTAGRNACRAQADWDLVALDTLRAGADTAVTACRAALSADPDNTTLLSLLARALDAADQPAEAHPLYTRAAEAGNPQAMNALGALYERGRGVAQDYRAAATWYRAAAEGGETEGMNNIGIMLLHGAGIDQSDRAALRWFQAAAEAGDTTGMTNLGFMHAQGRGVDQNHEEAMRWFRAAAEAGDTGAMRSLARAYELGRGVVQSVEEAARWYRAAAESGDAGGMTNLGVMYASGIGVSQSESAAARWFSAAAEAGDPAAMSNLGTFYASGRGVAQSDSEAVRWYRAAAEAGDPGGMSGLGFMYRRGRGVAQSDAEAVRWYRAAAEAGDTSAMSNLGFMYLNGLGVAQNDGEAFRWLSAAAEAGDPAGMRNLAAFYLNGQAVAQSDSEALRWYRAAATAGDAAAMGSLGTMYLMGRGVAVNDRESVRWYRAAAEGGDAAGMAGLGFMYASGRGVPQDGSEATRWYRAAAEAGDVTGMTNLGISYDIGRGVARDPVRAADLLLAAARNGSTWLRANAAARHTQTIRELHRLLAQAGHYRGPLDAAWGPDSAAALDAYVAQR